MHGIPAAALTAPYPSAADTRTVPPGDSSTTPYTYFILNTYELVLKDGPVCWSIIERSVDYLILLKNTARALACFPDSHSWPLVRHLCFDRLIWIMRITYEDALAATKAGHFTLPETGGMDCVLMCPTEYIWDLRRLRCRAGIFFLLLPFPIWSID